MRLRILDLAEADLLSGFRFYERRCRGLGWYFLDTLSADIQSLHLYAGVHRKCLRYFRMFPVVFHPPSTTESSVMRSKCGASLIADVIRIGFVDNSAGIEFEYRGTSAI